MQVINLNEWEIKRVIKTFYECSKMRYERQISLRTICRDFAVVSFASMKRKRAEAIEMG